jgi:SAM-dependent methyltransferase/uncharacterized protein YbaR (Trm112 family)
MNPLLLPLLADPNDGQPLELHAFAEHSPRNSTTVREGVLVQPQTGRWYPIRDAIPSLFVDALRVGDELAADRAFAHRHRDAMENSGARFDVTPGHDIVGTTQSTSDGDFSRIDSERRARDEQAESYDRMLSLKVYERLETPTYRQAMIAACAPGQTPFVALSPLLEAGCGTGRFTGLFAGMAEQVVAVDMSRDSILRNRVRHAGKTLGEVHYIHADLTHLPFRDGLFGSVAHCGVYEHIPSRELRRQFLSHARRTMKPGGVFLLSAYRYGGITKLFGKEGEHAGGIPFTRFTEAELRAEVEPYFSIENFRANLGIYMSMLVGKAK